ncbi:MAG: hypothetical protein ACLFVS_03230 [Candidatus Acetothermia bacterium]
MSAIKPKVYETWAGTKVELWDWLEKKIGNQKKPFPIDQSMLAEKFGVSRTSIINALKTFARANLIKKMSSGRGRGNHSKYKLKWTFRDKNEKVERINVTPSRVEGVPPRKKLTKGSRTFRYFAYQFRTSVEKSSLKRKSSVVVGELLKFLVGKSREFADSILIYFKRWLSGPPRTLKDFFVYLHQTLKKLLIDEEKRRKTEEFIAEQQQRKQEVRQEFQENPPPRLKDFSRMSDYLKAMEEWEEKNNSANEDQSQR